MNSRAAFPHDPSYAYDADHVTGEIFNSNDDLQGLHRPNLLPFLFVDETPDAFVNRIAARLRDRYASPSGNLCASVKSVDQKPSPVPTL